MYDGQTRFTPGTYPKRGIVVNRRTGQLGAIGITATWGNTPALSLPMPWEGRAENAEDFTETNTANRFTWHAPLKLPPAEFDMQEITVSAKRIPWWLWGIGGVLAARVFLK